MAYQVKPKRLKSGAARTSTDLKEGNPNVALSLSKTQDVNEALKCMNETLCIQLFKLAKSYGNLVMPIEEVIENVIADRSQNKNIVSSLMRLYEDQKTTYAKLQMENAALVQRNKFFESLIKQADQSSKMAIECSEKATGNICQDDCESAGVMSESAGVMSESAGVMSEIAGVTGESAGVTGESAGVMGEKGGVMSESAGVMGEKGGVMGESADVMGESAVVMGESGGRESGLNV